VIHSQRWKGNSGERGRGGREGERQGEMEGETEGVTEGDRDTDSETARDKGRKAERQRQRQKGRKAEEEIYLLITGKDPEFLSSTFLCSETAKLHCCLFMSHLCKLTNKKS